MLFAPLEGWRRVGGGPADESGLGAPSEEVEDYPLVLVMDNLNTHHPASLYEAFEPMEALL